MLLKIYRGWVAINYYGNFAFLAAAIALAIALQFVR